MIEPDPPVDVRLVLDDETELPVQTVYCGVGGVDRHTHMWGVVEPFSYARLKGVKIGLLPPHSAVFLPSPNELKRGWLRG